MDFLAAYWWVFVVIGFCCFGFAYTHVNYFQILWKQRQRDRSRPPGSKPNTFSKDVILNSKEVAENLVEAVRQSPTASNAIKLGGVFIPVGLIGLLFYFLGYGV